MHLWSEEVEDNISSYFFRGNSFLIDDISYMKRKKYML